MAKNEGKNLPRCLASVQGWVSEILVALNDTTDDSAAIAEKFGARVRHLKWQGYRDTKNAALALAGQPWALMLDADEEVSPALKRDLEEFLARPDSERFAGAAFPRKAWYINRWITHGDWYPDLGIRLLRCGRARWGGDPHVHEKAECDGPVATLRGDLLHYPFPTLAAQQMKIVEYARLFAEKKSMQDQPSSLMAAVTRPPWRFFRGYILRRGFQDGFPGFVAAVSMAYYTFLRYASHYERSHRADS